MHIMPTTETNSQESARSPYLHAALSGTLATVNQLSPPYESAFEFVLGVIFAALIQAALAFGVSMVPQYRKGMQQIRGWFRRG